MDPAQALPDLLSVTGAAQLQLGNLSEAVADLSRALGARPEAATRSRATDGAARVWADRTGSCDAGRALPFRPRADPVGQFCDMLPTSALLIFCGVMI
jgi:hypothetical protein